MAKERGIDLQAVNVQGSGTFGSIVSGDLDKATVPVMQPSQVGDYEDTPHSQTRKVKEFYNNRCYCMAILFFRLLPGVFLKQRTLFPITTKFTILTCLLC